MSEYQATSADINRLIHRVRHETLDAVSVSLVTVGGWSHTRILRSMQHAIRNLAFDLDDETICALLYEPDPDLDSIDSKKATQ